MADILPFQAVRYNQDKLGGNLADVVAPPYDVISPDEQAALYDRSPYNVIRLILGRETDKYARAASLFEQWKSSEVLLADNVPSIYVYHQTFNDPITGAPAPDRIGLVCLLKLEEYASGKVLPHENTLTAAKSDRLELLRATHAQFESIYGLYSDPDSAVLSFLSEFDDREPIIERVDGLIGSSHTVERIGNPSAIATLMDLLRDKNIFIADGHHRYETSLNYRRETRKNHPEIPETTPIPEDYILITLTAFEDEGLLVLPTHRLVRNVDPDRILRLITGLSEQFEVTPTTAGQLSAAIAEASAAGRRAFGLVLPGGRVYLAAFRKPASALADLIPGPEAPVTKALDVTLLQRLVLENQLGIGAEELAKGGHVSYTRDIDEVLAKVAGGEYQAGFILGRPSVTEVREVSLAGDKMPQKSTFFFPKLLSGLLLRDLTLDKPGEVMLPDAD